MHKRIFKSIGIVAAVAATAVPSAFAMHSADDNAGAVTPVAGVSVKADTSDVFTRYVASHQPVSVPYLSHGIGVDAAQFGGTGVAQTTVRPDDKAGVRTTAPSPIVSATSTGNGFDWGDAGIGAGGAMGLFLLMSLGMALGQRNRKGPLTA
jgi:hypothetical protein